MGSVGLWFHFLTALEYVAEIVSSALFGLLSRLLFLNCLQSINCSVDLTALMLQRPIDLANINPRHVAFSILPSGKTIIEVTHWEGYTLCWCIQ
jgi:hypothetical protein